MKKCRGVILFLLFGLPLLAGPFTEKDIPEDVKKEIEQHFLYTSSDTRRQDIEDEKEAYIRLQNKAYDSGIPKEDLEVIIVRLHQMYGTNFRKQSAEFDREAGRYYDMIKKVEDRLRAEQEAKNMENQKAGQEIVVLLEKNILPRELAERLLKIAKQKYPNNVSAQKYFLEGAITLYQIKK